MPLQNVPLTEIQVAVLNSLIENEVPEGRTIEYKSELPSNAQSDKREFLADVSSFANSAGGDLIFGIIEESGIATSVNGLSDIDIDQEVLRLENLLRDGIDPRIPGFQIHPIPCDENQFVIIIRIPRSYALPHAVTLGGGTRFFARNSRGKYQLDVNEIRSHFILSETATEKIRSFRIERLSQIGAGETPIPLSDTPKIVLHIIPLASFSTAAQHAPSELSAQRNHLTPPYSGSTDVRFTLDGYMCFLEGSAYVQLYRNGIIEFADSHLLRERQHNFVPSLTFEDRLIGSLPNFFTALQRLGVEPPVFIMLCLLEVGELSMAPPSGMFFAESRPFDRDILIIPEIMIESFDVNIDDALKPIFDTVWNASGWPGSPYYDESGQRIRHP